MKLSDITTDENGFYVSLSKLVGSPIKDIVGIICDPYGGTVIFQLTHIVFENGLQLHVEGEHDLPYIPSQEDVNGLEEETLEALLDESDNDD